MEQGLGREVACQLQRFSCLGRGSDKSEQKPTWHLSPGTWQGGGGSMAGACEWLGCVDGARPGPSRVDARILAHPGAWVLRRVWDHVLT